MTSLPAAAPSSEAPTKLAGKKRKLEDIEEGGEKNKSQKLTESDTCRKIRSKISSLKLRVPSRNRIPNIFVTKKTHDRRGKLTKLERERKNRDFFLNLGISQNTLISGEHGVNARCSSCHCDGDRFFIYDYHQGDTICTNCSVVQSQSLLTLEDQNPKYLEKRKRSGDSRGAYIAEKIRQFSNSEPRISDQDLWYIRNVYHHLCSDFNSDHSVLKRLQDHPCVSRIRSWFEPKEEDLTKRNIRGLLNFIDKTIISDSQEISYSFRKKYLERWTQIKAYLCGHHYYYNFISDKPSERLRDFMLRIATLVSFVFQEQQSYEDPEEDCCSLLKKKKKNIPNLDLLFLMILYADGEDTLEAYGWYFVSKNMHEYAALEKRHLDKSPEELEALRGKKKFSAILQNFASHKKILMHINTNYTKTLCDILDDAGVEPSNSLRIPENLQTLVNIAALNKSAYQFE